MVFKALVDCTDKEIYEHINPGNEVWLWAGRI
jgi:hypothetical protein